MNQYIVLVNLLKQVAAEILKLGTHRFLGGDVRHKQKQSG